MKKYSLILQIVLLTILSGPVFGQYLGQNREKIKVKTQISAKALSFDLKDVKLLDGPFKKAMELDQTWLKSLENSRLLHNFRVNAGLKTGATPYGGWETLDCELRGHSMGHILSALAMMYSSTGDTAYKNKGTALVKGLAECQKVLKKEGYLSAFPEYLIDRVISDTPVWAPWYTLHKLYAGLIDMYLQCNDNLALDVVTKMGDWACNKLEPLTDPQMQVMLRAEHGGMNEAMYNLYAITGNPRYLKLAERFYHNAVLDPLAQKTDHLEGLHANTQIPKIIGEACGYELTGNTVKKTAAEFFYETVLKNHTYVTGGNSDGEYFGPAGKLSDRLSDNTTETCNTYNMLKLARHLFTWSANAQIADYYEKALYNHILASQNPEDGMVTYYLTLRPGNQKSYSTPFKSFWCCVGTGFENHSKYNEAIYYKAQDGGLYLNLFIPSVLTWKEKGITVQQETRFPEEEATHLTISCDKGVTMPIYVRYPGWAKTGISILVNGKKIAVKAIPGSYISVNRKWGNGDKVDILMPMSLNTEAMPDNKNKAALLYGPIVLAGDLGNAEPDPAFGVPVLVTNGKPITEWVKKVVGKPLTFKTEGVGRPDEVTLMPLYKISGDHYTVYWDFFTQADWGSRQAEFEARKKADAEISRRTIDVIGIGESQSERDHHFEGENTFSAGYGGRKWRDARDGGWFQYELKVDPKSQVELMLTFWGNDNGGQFNLLANGVKIASPTPGFQANKFFNLTFPIPQSLVGDKDKLLIKIQALPGESLSGIFGCRILKKEK